MAIQKEPEESGGRAFVEVDGILDEDQESEAFAASQWQLMWWKFRKHRVAMAAGLVIVSLYMVAVFCEFIAPYALDHREVEYAFAPPQRLKFYSDEGLHLWPFVYGYKGIRHPETLRKFYVEDRSTKYPIRVFVRGESRSRGEPRREGSASAARRLSPPTRRPRSASGSSSSFFAAEY